MALAELRESLGLTRNKSLVLASILLVIFLAAVDVTVVETAMPTIIGVLSGAQLYSWVFTIYLLSSTVTTPLFGKLADLYGRKRVLLAGVSIFVFGSMLCGLSQSMLQLVIFRGIQGIGAGCVLPVAQTVAADLFSPTQRARIQGIFALVWGTASLSGPLLGGLIVDFWSWRWIFYINLPVGLFAMAMLWRHLHEGETSRRQRVDYVGAFLLTGGTAALMLALSLVGIGVGWGEWRVAGLLAAAAALLFAFSRAQVHADDPFLPLHLFRHPMLWIPNISGFLLGAVMMGFSVYLPLFRQGVQGGTATDAGLVLMPLSLGWDFGALIGGSLVLRLGYRWSVAVGSLCQAIAATVMVAGGFRLDLSPWLLRVAMLLIGAGMGFSTLAILLAAQGSVGYRLRGVVTGTVTFIRTLGQTIGLAALATLLNLQLLKRLRAIPGLELQGTGQAGAIQALNVINRLVDPAQRVHLPPDRLLALEKALAGALMPVFWVLVGIAILSTFVSLRIPAGKPQDRDGTGEVDAAPGGADDLPGDAAVGEV